MGCLDPLRHAALDARYRRYGVEAVNARLLRPGRGADEYLARFGATIRKGPLVYGPITIHNADPDYRNLTIGEHAHVGRGVLLDLADELVIDDEATVSMGCTILTHQDIGDRPLARLYPRYTARTVIGYGAYLGANATVLAGASVGERTVVGAGAVVTQPLPANVVAVGAPARVVKELEVAHR